MMPGMNPKQMEKLMKQMGIKSRNISAAKVTIESDEGNIIVENPQITEIVMQGQKSYQISGDVKVEEQIKEDDVKLVMEQAGCTRDEAVKALEEKNGDIAEAILLLERNKNIGEQ